MANAMKGQGTGGGAQSGDPAMGIGNRLEAEAALETGSGDAIAAAGLLARAAIAHRRAGDRESAASCAGRAARALEAYLGYCRSQNIGYKDDEQLLGVCNRAIALRGVLGDREGVAADRRVALALLMPDAAMALRHGRDNAHEIARLALVYAARTGDPETMRRVRGELDEAARERAEELGARLQAHYDLWKSLQRRYWEPTTGRP